MSDMGGTGGGVGGRGHRQLDIEVESTKEKRSLIISLAWPALAENFLVSITSMIDMIMVSSLGGFAIAAVGLVAQPRFVMLSAFMAMNVGSTAMISRFRGARDPENANLVLGQSLLMGLSLSAILCVIMFIWGENLIRFLAGGNISPDTIQGASEYLRIQVYGFPLMALTFTMNAALRGVGNTRATFYNNSVSNLSKILFNYCLITGGFGFPALGIRGAAISMVLSQAVGFFMVLSKVISGKEYIRIEFKKVSRFDFSMMKRIFNIGFPALIEQVFMRVGVMLFTIIVTSLGNYSYQAHIIAMNLQQMSFMTGMSFGIAATTLVGQCLGRLREDLARLYVKLTLQLNLIVAVAVAMLLFFGGELICSLYSDDPELVRLAANMLKIIALVNPVSASRFVYSSALRGAGDSRFSAVITFVGVLVLRPLISYLLVFPPFPFQLGLAGIWIALSSDGIVAYILSMNRFKRGKWANIKV